MGQKIAERFDENFLWPPMTRFSVLYLRIWVLGCRLKLAAFGPATSAPVTALCLSAANPSARILLSSAVRVGRDTLN